MGLHRCAWSRPISGPSDEATLTDFSLTDFCRLIDGVGAGDHQDGGLGRYSVTSQAFVSSSGAERESIVAARVIEIGPSAEAPQRAALLVGREAERARIGGLLDSARRQRSGALVMVGEPGIGKTALCAWAIDAAAEMRVLIVRSIESESDLAYAGLAELCAGEDLGDLQAGTVPPRSSSWTTRTGLMRRPRTRFCSRRAGCAARALRWLWLRDRVESSTANVHVSPGSRSEGSTGAPQLRCWPPSMEGCRQRWCGSLSIARAGTRWRYSRCRIC
jgi:hypothetical protein